MAAEKEVGYDSRDTLSKKIDHVQKSMRKAAGTQDFVEAARLRDIMFGLKAIYKEKFGDK